jgi:outer membrane protein OmpA-like peptidoglycan-associated protein
VPGGALVLNGGGNRVTYAPVGGTQDATVTQNGVGNTVIRTASNETGTATTVGGTAAQGGIVVRGSHGETVQIGPGGIVATPQSGTGPTAVISPGAIIANGAGMVAATPSAVATSPGQLLLSGDGQTRDMPCTQAEVMINGNNGHFTLRGGCRQLVVHGNNNIVHAELTPTTQIGITGENSTIYVLLNPAGNDPAMFVTGTNNHVIRVQQLDDTTGTEIPLPRSTGALPGPVGVPTGTIVGSASLVIPAAALSFARGQSLATLQHDLGAVQTQQGTAVSLSGDVLFDFDRDHLRSDALRSLAELSVLITRTQPRGLQIVGYTDSLGTPQYNLDLSARRARNVEHWLLSEGQVRIAALDVEGRGAAAPVAPNTLPDGQDNPTGRQENRRVEVLLLRQ